MTLGNNRDYKTSDRRARKNLKKHSELMEKLIKQGMSRNDASREALRMMECWEKTKKEWNKLV